MLRGRLKTRGLIFREVDLYLDHVLQLRAEQGRCQCVRVRLFPVLGCVLSPTHWNRISNDLDVENAGKEDAVEEDIMLASQLPEAPFAS